MGNQPDFLRMAEAAREQRERQAREAREQREREEREAEEAKTRELEAVAGEAYLEFDELFSADLDHPVKVGRYREATQVLRGERASAGAPPTSTQSTSALPSDYASFSDDQRRIIDLVAMDGGRFVIEPSGAVKDKQYTRLNRNYQAEQAAAQGGNEGSSEPATHTAAKKTTPATKAVPRAPRSGSTATETPPPAPAQAPAPQPLPAPEAEALTPTPQPQPPAGQETAKSSNPPTATDRLAEAKHKARGGPRSLLGWALEKSPK